MLFLSPTTRAHLAAVNSSTSLTINWSLYNSIPVTLTGNCVFTFTAPPTDAVLYLKLTQDGSGSKTVTWPGNVKWPGAIAPTLSTAAAAVDIVTMVYDKTLDVYYAQYAKNFS